MLTTRPYQTFKFAISVSHARGLHCMVLCVHILMCLCCASSVFAVFFLVILGLRRNSSMNLPVHAYFEVTSVVFPREFVSPVACNVPSCNQFRS